MNLNSDGLFDLQVGTFLYVHKAKLVRISQLQNNYVADEDGTPVSQEAQRIDVTGYATAPSMSTINSTSTRVDLIWLLPNDVEADLQDYLEIPEQVNLRKHQTGTFRIDDIRPNLLHQRCFLSRPMPPNTADKNSSPYTTDPFDVD
jgi:hypothetical protein